MYMDKRAKEREEANSPGQAMAAEAKMRTNISPMLLLIPATCDVCASSLTFVGLTMVPPSVY